MKRFLAIMMSAMMLLAMLSVSAVADDAVTISFFDKNSGVRTFTPKIPKIRTQFF